MRLKDVDIKGRGVGGGRKEVGGIIISVACACEDFFP